MPVLCIVASVVLQAAVYGHVSGRLDSAGSLALSCAGFGAAALVFNAVLLVRGARRGPGAPAAPRARGLLVLMNVVTAVTFLSFYASLTWIPSALATGVETAIGPAVLALLGLTRFARRVPWRGWAAAAVLVLLGVGCGVRFTGSHGLSGDAAVRGLTLVLVAGAGAAVLALISAELGRRGVDPVHVTAHRFHLTYLCGAGLLVVTGGTDGAWTTDLTGTLVTGLLAVTLPLFLLQAGLQRTDPMVSMVLLTTLPGATYLAETAFHGSFDPGALALICALIAVAVGYARVGGGEPEAAPAAAPGGDRAGARAPAPRA
ncbi:hypothetical protein TU94_22990 [Streptomyces cyaneogriseus subsp. noncyanogenus]|uniref:EamA domain-containing protein n=1 Tax=Streptomyces cyaneogriseus subsp. noncyanogenus TaxID=477245 RepID=A0A0C5GHL0_9ACTN|nr:hypothetical protein [Streptomyces cyaneogriseus]AJP03906.1 hypothetical protein TU94_22990 [Streptomyces cyaneogriseus subsp. noncyanogenus]